MKTSEIRSLNITPPFKKPLEEKSKEKGSYIPVVALSSLALVAVWYGVYTYRQPILTPTSVIPLPAAIPTVSLQEQYPEAEIIQGFQNERSENLTFEGIASTGMNQSATAEDINSFPSNLVNISTNSSLEGQNDFPINSYLLWGGIGGTLSGIGIYIYRAEILDQIAKVVLRNLVL